MELDVLRFSEISPLAAWGYTNRFWSLHSDTLCYTWAAMIALFCLVFFIRRKFFDSESYFYLSAEYCVDFFATLCVETIGYFKYSHLAFIFSLFAFTAASCLISLLPMFDEATKDANTTFALSLCSFIYVAAQCIKHDGVLGYLSHYLGPKEMPLIARILLMPLETMGQLSRILSMAFRLFGNVLGGAVVYHLLVSLFVRIKEGFILAAIVAGIIWFVTFQLLRKRESCGIAKWISRFVQMFFVMAWAQMLFGVFEPLIQSFVLAMLTITYLSLQLPQDEESTEERIQW